MSEPPELYPVESKPEQAEVGQAKIEKEKKWVPLLLSAAICPGLGQWMQGRRFMGILLLVGFVGFFILTMAAILRPFLQTIDYINGNRYEPVTFGWFSIFGNFFGCIFVYAINVVDVWFAEKRLKRESA